MNAEGEDKHCGAKGRFAETQCTCGVPVRCAACDKLLLRFVRVGQRVFFDVRAWRNLSIDRSDGDRLLQLKNRRFGKPAQLGALTATQSSKRGVASLERESLACAFLLAPVSPRTAYAGAMWSEAGQRRSRRHRNLKRSARSDHYCNRDNLGPRAHSEGMLPDLI
jgi:hypothetical protein